MIKFTNSKIQKKINHKAFSLIELSIVILIIGILVAGVTQSSRLIGQMKIMSARSLTLSSPIASIKDIYSWHETTLEKSFDQSEASNQTNVTNWYDLNPQISSGQVKMIQNNLANKAIYKTNSINGLPTLDFDGNDFFVSETLPPSITSSGSATVFVVFNSKDVSLQRYIIFQGHNNCSTNIEIGQSAGSAHIGNFGIHSGCGYSSSSPASTLTINQPYIMTLAMLPSPLSPGSNGNINIYKNGIQQTTVLNGSGYNTNLGGTYGKINSNINFATRANGSDCFFIGSIGEIIIFSRSLNSEERSSVEKYLGKKWGIAVQ